MEEKTLIRNWSPKRPGYWKVYHHSHEHDILEVFRAICQLVENLERPWKVSTERFINYSIHVPS